MPLSTSIVVTSISGPNPVLQSLAKGAIEHGWDFIVAGDAGSPPDFELDGCRFLSLEAQRASSHSLGQLLPERSYSRKNLGYLDAITRGADVIVETDDDNFPRETFWHPRERVVRAQTVDISGWVNVYAYFAKEFIWPRGLPLEHARAKPPIADKATVLECPIQQGLANENPDVDAVYRMLFPLPVNFEDDVCPIALLGSAWCPFNSQNTTVFCDLFPLLYLPAHCSFRMTDIWRSFVARRILQEMRLPLLFHGATVWQERNEHNLHRDFCEEIPGYHHNSRLRSVLMDTDLSGEPDTASMMRKCYRALSREGFIGGGELNLLEAWFSDLKRAGCPQA